MPLALLCGEPGFDDSFAGPWLGRLDPRNVTIFGARSIDRDERKLLQSRGVDVVDMRKIDQLGVVVLMQKVLERVKTAGAHLHVSLDLDAMDPSIAPGGGTLVPGGLSYREAHLIMEMLHDSGSCRITRRRGTQPLPGSRRAERHPARGPRGKPVRPVDHGRGTWPDGIHDRGVRGQSPGIRSSV